MNSPTQRPLAGRGGQPEAPCVLCLPGLSVPGLGLHLGHRPGGRQSGGAAAGAAVQDGLQQRLRPGGEGVPPSPPICRSPPDLGEYGVCMPACMCACMRAWACICVRVPVRIHACMRVLVCACVHMHVGGLLLCPLPAPSCQLAGSPRRA